MMPSPVHIIVHGRPISFQSRGPALTEWKRKVAAAARMRIPTPSWDDELAVSITHFYRVPPRCDADNMSKPICDAMINVVYRDDWQISERIARRMPLSRPFELGGMPRELAMALCESREFVHVRIAVMCSRHASPIHPSLTRW